ncbi:hypothetical protein Y032_0010g1016 [Ancylostoma ceylanicum]|uniref:SCP domain-containing protein n=1 Tax=Ancylostoma ceylanicum TaxID=53326 RepID=A0A016VGQ3_9BILA|nr:hypothetical protein Y032_0010g1016 [Ancylostoma ceylanicum]
MLNLLLVFLCVGAAFSQVTVCTNDPKDTDVIRTSFLDGHNTLRKELIGQTGLVQADGEKLPGSRNMFKITYDCYLEGLALTTMSGCGSKPELAFVGQKSVNYVVIRGIDPKKPPKTEADYVPYIKQAVADWANYMYDDNLDIKTVIYKESAMEPFANWASVAVRFPQTWVARVATAPLVKELPLQRPELSKPLYEPSKATDGCTSAGKRCEKFVKGSKCIASSDNDGKFEGLCRTDLKEISKP